ncbi:MAG: dCMP deaminase family protein [Candidatus Heimdallarchaeota archaeon]|nr:dCMP deaminase family protein [Candidatus Heimdallarchaeota archaeon]
MNGHRPPWNVYFGKLAQEVATRATCSRKKVGAVIVRDKNILSTGYNGSIIGTKHCTEVGCLMENGHCVRTIHAEANAIIQAAKHGVRLEGASIYVTASPCFNCFKLIANAGIKKIYYLEFYRDDRIMRFAAEIGIDLIDLSKVQKLVQLAAKDEVISDDEKQIINSFLEIYEDFSIMVNKSRADDKIDFKERGLLIKKRNEILDLIYSLAERDEHITEDEKVLLDEISDILKELAGLNA